MLINSFDIDSSVPLQSTICVVGAGPAGISLALQFKNISAKVLLIESGGLKITPEREKLNEAVIEPGTSHEPLEIKRRRTIGGATSAWGGRCIPFDPIDFETRPFIPDSEWPISMDEVEAYYPRANSLCEAGPCKYTSDEALPDKQSETIVGFDNQDIVSNRLERWSPPTHFGKRYQKELTEAPNIEVVYNLTVTHLELDELGVSVAEVIAKRPDGAVFTLKADTFILAASCIENTRMLLNSDSVHPSGIGNQHDLVGRYYMAHFQGISSRVKFNPGMLAKYVHDFEKDESGVYVRRRFTLTAKAQREMEIGNIIGFFLRPELHDPSHKDGVMSMIYLSKEKKSEILSGKWEHSTRRHMANVVKDLPKSFPRMIKILRERNQDRRLPSVLLPKDSPFQYFFYQSEQVPNPDSRITLSHEMDPMGIPKAQVGIRFKEMDTKTIVEFHRAMSQRFAETGTGEFSFDEGKLREEVQEKIRDFHSGSHFIGTTRMSENPKKGVVDKNGKVHGINNLYISGASTFPTGSHANPTLTIVALAVRLGERLLVESKKSLTV